MSDIELNQDAVHIDLVRRYMSEVARPDGDLALLDTLFTDDVAIHRSGATTHGLDALRAWAAARTTASAITTEFLDVFGAGDRVAVRMRHEVTYGGPELSRVGMLDATGADVEWQSISIYRFAGDKIAEMWVERDDLGILLQLGRVTHSASVPARP